MIAPQPSDNRPYSISSQKRQEPPMNHAGPMCRRCRTSEAGCARSGQCCARCTHNFGEVVPLVMCSEQHATIARVSQGPAPFVAICLDCGRISSQQRLISVVLDQLARLHGRQSWARPVKRAA